MREQGQSRWMAVPWAGSAAAWAALLVVDSPLLALAFALASRAAYVLYLGFTLRSRAARPAGESREDALRAFRRFRRLVGWLMHSDGVALVLVAWIGRGTLKSPLPSWALPSLGAAFIVAGLTVKTWAAAVLPNGAWWWKGCFLPEASGPLVTSGPYRWFHNPMYTAGYLHAYGPALLLGSLPGLLAAAAAQASMLAVNAWAERPHTLALPLPEGG